MSSSERKEGYPDDRKETQRRFDKIMAGMLRQPEIIFDRSDARGMIDIPSREIPSRGMIDIRYSNGINTNDR